MSNLPYQRSIDLKQKKVFELLREGGFNSLGYELGKTLKPHVVEHWSYGLPKTRIYQEIKIARVGYLVSFVELMTSAPSLQHLSELTTHFRTMLPVAESMSQGISLPIANAYLQQ